MNDNVDQFIIAFTADDVQYEGEVWPDYDKDNKLLFQVSFNPVKDPRNKKIIFLENSDIGKWIELSDEGEEDDANLPVINAVGKEIERNQSSTQASTNTFPADSAD